MTRIVIPNIDVLKSPECVHRDLKEAAIVIHRADHRDVAFKCVLAKRSA